MRKRIMRIRLAFYANAHNHRGMGASGRSKAAAALKQWMGELERSQADLAVAVTERIARAPGRIDKTPINQSTISSWTRGVNTPSGLAMIALEEITEGRVTAKDWLVPADESAVIVTKPAA